MGGKYMDYIFPTPSTPLKINAIKQHALQNALQSTKKAPQNCRFHKVSYVTK